MQYIKNFSALTLTDIPSVGGKNASIGQMIQDLQKMSVRVPGGFAITVDAYWAVLEANKLVAPLKKILAPVKKNSSMKILQAAGKKARSLIEHATMPEAVTSEIKRAYQELCKEKKQADCSVAVRSSATAEDLPEASFAGQQDTYLNVMGADEVVKAVRNCMASLFTDRAIIYRLEKGFDHFAVGLSVGIQYMVRSDLAASGVMFTLDTESGFKDAIVVTSSYGLGESVVRGEVVPDEFHVFKTTLEKGFSPIIKKERGSKKIQKVFKPRSSGISTKAVPAAQASQFSLTDAEVLELATYGLVIEKHYSKLKNSWSPMDIEWAKDGKDGKLYIVQARPETIYAPQDKHQQVMTTYQVKKTAGAKVLVEGQSIGQKVAQGPARIVKTVHDMARVKPGDILVTYMTDPDWVPVMKRAAGIITESGGRTCHAAIVSRELGIPALVGAAGALHALKDGQQITLDCSGGSQGYVYAGVLPVKVTHTELKTIKKAPVSLYVNIAAPDQAYKTAQLPVDGVGLARLEFIINNQVQAHPMAFIEPEKIKDKKTRDILKKLTAGYKKPQEFFIEKIAQGIGTIAAAFYPRSVLVRFSDFKSNEYRGLLGGTYFEPVEENPMMGLRGASRYYDPLYAPAFELECEAVRYARETMGLTNINVMVPFVRTAKEAAKVIEIVASHGLVSKKGGLQIFMMCEIPSNVILLEDFAKHFDGFSIGSNDLTQTTLSVDRDSGLLAPLFNEQDPAVMWMLKEAITRAKRAKKPIGICGQAPSDHPEIAQFLIQEGITSLSLNPDSVIPFLMRIKE